jgi:hypothetical protein|tara:strand:+ start:856 stop:1413 length:558 start_codon:yes stop_codon:yes gene_type:complete
MALQTSGPISLGQIAAEYNDAAPNSMSEYYGRSGFPSSGPISFFDAYGNSDNFSGYMTYQLVAVPEGDKLAAYDRIGYGEGIQGSLVPNTFNYGALTCKVDAIFRTLGGQVTPMNIYIGGFTSDPGISGVWSSMTKNGYTIVPTTSQYTWNPGADGATGTAQWNTWLNYNPISDQNGQLTMILVN